MAEMKQIIEESFAQYSAAVIQSRALVDARDCMKPSARQIFYCLYTDKFLPNKPFKKTLKAIGSAARMYIHGDSSCEGVIMRAAQPFAMRYPLIEVEGNAGNLMQSGNYAAPRYTASRLSDVMTAMFDDIDKNTINEWRNNYDDTEQYPMVLPTKGFYNIVNGNFGISVGLSSSIPQFNITDVNNALCVLLDNPNASFDDIYAAPDFATGAILLNEKEVKEALKNGTGAACKLRSVVDYDKKENVLVVSEIPYSVYTNTICAELEALIDKEEENPGVERFNDLTSTTPLIKIYLRPKADVNKVITYLYKNTSLQSFYPINLTMLENGRYPRVFGWKDALSSHIEHEKIVYRNAFEFDLRKINKRIHILDGILICLANIEDVVKTIKSSASTAIAAANLQKTYLLDEEQTKAVLDMKLSRLAHLEVQKLEQEKRDLQKEATRITTILNNEQLFNNELKNGWKEMARKLGDKRRTQIKNVEGENDEPIEVKQLQVSLTNHNNYFAVESSSLYTQRRGGIGTKFKLDAGEYVIDTHSVATDEQLLWFTYSGNFYQCAASQLTTNTKLPLNSVIHIADTDTICAFTSNNKTTSKKYITFITRRGYLKKSELSEYRIANRASGTKAIKLDEGDAITSALFMDEEQLGILTEQGNFIVINTNTINPIGRVTRGVLGIALNEGDNVISARIIPIDTKTIVSISGNGLCKQTSFDEFTVQGRGGKGVRIQKISDTDWVADFLPLSAPTDILVMATNSCIKLANSDIPCSAKNTQGLKTITLKAADNVVKISRA